MACNHPSKELAKTARADGGYHVLERCTKCLKNVTKPGPWLPQKPLIKQGVDIESLPTFDDYSLNNPPCIVCHKRGTQLHHFAPREFFPDTCELWPKAYLCQTHHQEWHNLITIPLRTLQRREQKRTKTNDQPYATLRDSVPQ